MALNEVGKIKPWFAKDVNAWVFEHPAYPVSYAGDTPEEVVKNYPLYLQEFIQERLKDNLAPEVEKATTGRGGLRPGAGRPKGTLGIPTQQIRVPPDIANWLRQPGIIPHLRQIMSAYKHV